MASSDPDPATTILSEMAGIADALPMNEEYTTVEQRFLATLGSSNACISTIFKLHNDDLRGAFEARRHSIASRRGIEPSVITVYHGTSLDAATTIAQHGFNPTYSMTAVYGKGIYASTRPLTALGYCKDVDINDNFNMVFMCDFVKGKFAFIGSQNRFTDECDYSGDGYDDILVTPYADGIVPNYLICFYTVGA